MIAWAALANGKVEHAWDVTEPGRIRHRSLCGKWRHRSMLDFAQHRTRQCRRCQEFARPKGRWG
jgi:hypothetical protein